MPRPKKIIEIESNPTFAPLPGEELSGVARSIVCFNHNGWPNYRIATVTINKGKVTKVNYSDPFANFEAIAKLEYMNEISMIRLNNAWLDGRAWFLKQDTDGKDIQDGLSG